MTGFQIKGNKVRGVELGGHNEIRFCRHGAMLVNKHDRYVGRSLRVYGEFSPQEQHLLASLIDKDSVVYEVGANIGALTIPLARRAKVVYAFEPQRLNFQMLCANIAMNQLRNVWAFPVAVGRMHGDAHIPMFDPTQAGNFGAVTADGDRGEVVERIRLALMDNRPLPHLIKIDVEGMELEVLMGAHALITKSQPFLYVECDREDKAEDLIGYMRDMLNYQLYWHLPPLYDSDNYEAESANVFPGIVSKNVLGVPRGRQFDTDLPIVQSWDEFPLAKG
jgi:FkbM family methyltransferase